MTDNNANKNKLATFDRFKQYANSIEIRERFADIVGKVSAGGYIQSVIIAVSNSDRLMECEPKSIMISALRAATLQLSCDQSMGHAYLVPYGKKATLIVGYKGYMQLMERTNQYRTVNIGTLWEGQELEIEPLSGLIAGIIGRRDYSAKPKGYWFYWRMLNGFEKAIYMTVDECMAHGEKYSPSFNRSDSIWKLNPSAMCKKTVVRQSIPFIYINPNDLNKLSTIDENENDDVDIPDENNVTMTPNKKHTSRQILSELGFDDDKEFVDGEFSQPKSTECNNQPSPEQYTAPAPTPVTETLADIRRRNWSSHIPSDEAFELKDSDGIKYCDIPTDKLSYHANSLLKSIKAKPDDAGLSDKLEVITALIKASTDKLL
jgi:recombination protein RecT